MKKDASRFLPKGVLFHRTFFTAPFVHFLSLIIIKVALRSVNPLHVGELISTAVITSVSAFLACVNPLRVGELISTEAEKLMSESIEVCQSPSCRGTHFYLCKNYSLVEIIGMCQSPSCRGTHFYRRRRKSKSSCQNLCQSPSCRGTHFYIQTYLE